MLSVLHKKSISILLATFVIGSVFLTGFGQGEVYACQNTNCPSRAAKIKSELIELKNAKIDTYIYWQYSGNNCNPWTDSNDQYSFFQGDPLCEVFKEAADGGMKIGVNIHELVPHAGEADQLKYLKETCGVSIVRFWAYKSIGGVDGAKQAVTALNNAGISAIPVICDYSNTCTEFGITGATQGDPTSWYESGYDSGGYLDYAKALVGGLSGTNLYGVELLNEPHCGGHENCVQPYTNWASAMASALGGVRVGIGQKASENTTRGDSPGVGTPSDFQRSNASVGMASAHFYNADEKSLALQAASQAQGMGKPFYIGERGMTCDGTGGSAPGGQTPRPPCNPNEYNLTIKGTIKSSYDFALVKGADGKAVYINRKDVPESDWVNYAFVNNVPINGAIAAIYPSYNFGGSDKFGNSHEYSPGMKGGMLYSERDVNQVRTGVDGNFELETTNTCDEVWQYNGWKQYLVIMCPGDTGSGVKPIVRDLYAFPLVKKNGEVYMGDIDVPCEPDLSKYGVVSVPKDLEYMVRRPDTFLACSDDKMAPMKLAPSQKIKFDYDLMFKDSHGGKKNWPWDSLIDELREAIRVSIPFRGSREGFLGVQGASCDIRSMFSSTTGFYSGIKSDMVELPQYYFNQDNKPGTAQTYNDNDYEEKIPLPLCDDLRKSNMSVVFDGDNNNTQASGGMYNNLRAPFDGGVYDSEGKLVQNKLGYAARFLNTDKDMEVCKEANTATALRHRLREIAPPVGICGDINQDGKIDKPLELPCPTDENCGDLDNNGSIDGYEKVCMAVDVTTGDVTIYTFDSFYFPYDVVFTGTTQPWGYEFQTRVNTYNDSVSPSSDEERGQYRRVSFGSTDGTQPDNVDTLGKNFPQGFQESKLPGGTYNSLTKTSELSGGKDDASFYPASLIMASPVEYGTPDINSVRKAIGNSASNIVYDSTTIFYKIGIPETLCSCSLIEKESKTDVNGVKLEKCIQTKERDVKIAQPLGYYNETSDPDLTSLIHWLQPGYKYMGDVRPGNERDKRYYDQRMNGIGDILKTIVDFSKEFIDCNWGSEEDVTVNGVPTGDRRKGADCGRKLKTIAQNMIYMPWLPDLGRMENALISATFLDVPFTKRPNIISTCQIDAAQTKAESPDEKQGSGLDLPFGSTADKAITDTVNLVSSPSLGGFVPTCEVGKWEKTLSESEAPKIGFFAVDCGGGGCWVAGGVENEDWNPATTAMFKSTDSGGTWERVSGLGDDGWFIHGVGASGTTKVATGAGGRIYTMSPAGSNWAISTPLRTKKGEQYFAFLYDITAAANFKYLATATGHVFYGEEQDDGFITWQDLAGSDAGAGPDCHEDRDWPYAGPGYDRRVDNAYCTEAEYANGTGCKCDENGSDAAEGRYCPIVPGSKPPRYDSSRKACNLPTDTDDTRNPNAPECCDNFLVPGQQNNGTPNCICTGSPTKPNPDKTDRTPNCLAEGGVCWGWHDSSIWAVDCNSSGDCLIAGQKLPNVWYAPNDKLGDTATWWANKKELQSNSFAMGVSFPGKTTGYVVGGGRDKDVTDAFIMKSTDIGTGNTWLPAMGGVDSSKYGLKSIDCISKKSCVAVGNFGTILITDNGGATWVENWADDEVIKKAKAERVRFWDVSYMGEDSIVVVGFRPGGGDNVDGVIYTLGQCVPTYASPV
ncbi:TPA: hypothetical protein DCY43_00625 [candidate division WWE3 bacterium]|uniref:Uncharacterized protein n=2 Tax=Katanobacteria TaxID=422282 RepID=A0A351JSH6_UNCKA|nr:hypothetical protein [candidate division WWE3 bacterium]